MPFKWEKGKNPYTCNYFGTLQLGPNATHHHILAKARSLGQKMAVGQKIKSAADQELDEHTVNEASVRLRDPRSAAEELLLVHTQPQGEGESKVKPLFEQLRKRASFSGDRQTIPLRGSLGIFWFLPAPGREAAELPQLEELGLIGPGDPEDLALDIVFDQ